jgi:hypothetical protein
MTGFRCRLKSHGDRTLFGNANHGDRRCDTGHDALGNQQSFVERKLAVDAAFGKLFCDGRGTLRTAILFVVTKGEVNGAPRLETCGCE